MRLAWKAVWNKCGEREARRKESWWRNLSSLKWGRRMMKEERSAIEKFEAITSTYPTKFHWRLSMPHICLDAGNVELYDTWLQRHVSYPIFPEHIVASVQGEIVSDFSDLGQTCILSVNFTRKNIWGGKGWTQWFQNIVANQKVNIAAGCYRKRRWAGKLSGWYFGYPNKDIPPVSSLSETHMGLQLWSSNETKPIGQ